MIAALLECEEPMDLLMSNKKEIKELRERRRKIKEEIDELVRKYTKSADFFDKLIVYKIESRYGIKGDVANILQELNPDSVIMVYTEKKDVIRISMRTNTEKDLAEMIKESLKGLDGRGGGHSKASGLEIAKKDFEKFLDRVKKRME